MQIVAKGGIVGRQKIIRAALITAGLLLIPLCGNAFVEGWNWNLGGFIAAGTFIFTAALFYRLAARIMGNQAYRTTVGLAVEELSVWIAKHHLKQAEAAEILMVSRPRVSDVVNKKTAKFTIDTLVEMLSRVDKPVKLAIS